MNKDEAKFILQAYRPGIDDPASPEFAEALALLEGDPELARWYEEERQLDEIMRRQLARIHPPADLKAKIAAGQRVERPHPLRKGRRWPAWAASLMLLVGLAGTVWWLPSEPPAARAWEEAMLETVASGFDLDFRHPRVDQIEAWLTRKGPSLDYQIPPALKASDGLGCRHWIWKDRQVALICFQIAEGRMLHLFMVDATGLESGDMDETPRLRQDGEWTTARWQKGEIRYLVLSKADHAVVQSYL